MYEFTRWAPQDRSGKVCWLLNELEIEYSARDLVFEKHHDDPDYRKVHPLGATPALRDLETGQTMFESGAICLFLADRHAEKGLLPKEKKAACYQWVVYNYATIEPAVTAYWDVDHKDPEMVDKKLKIDEAVLELLRPVEDVLSKSKFIAGDEFTVADIPIGQSLHWLRLRPFFSELPKSADYLNRLKSRVAATKAGLFAET